MEHRLLRCILQMPISMPSRVRVRGASLPEYGLVVVAILVAGAVGYRLLGSPVKMGVDDTRAVFDGDAPERRRSGGARSPSGDEYGASGRQPVSGLGDKWEELRRRFRGDKPPTVNYDAHETKATKGSLYKAGTSAPNARDVSQGAIGDCYLMASVAAVTHSDPKALAKQIRELGDGRYGVTLYDRGFFGSSPKEVVVDNELPTGAWSLDEKTGKYSWHENEKNLAFAHKENGLWPAIVEKGYAQANGGYDKIGHGGYPSDAMSAITGQPSTIASSDKVSFEQFDKMVKDGYAVVPATRPAPKNRDDWPPKFKDDTLVFSHAYWVESVDSKAKTVTVRNPWGWQSAGESGVTLSYEDFQKHFPDIYSNPVRRRP